MISLETNYMGLILKNPIVAGSSGFTNSAKLIKQLASAGVGAVVLKSLFEEQINLETRNIVSLNDQNYSYPGAEEYIRNYTRSNSLQQYLDLVAEVKKSVEIPVIASINCVSNSDWTTFAKDIEAAGADAIELNIFEMPVDRNKLAENYEQKYFDILKAVKSSVSIPVAVKISQYFTNIVHVVDQLYANGAGSVVLFNRFWEPDINLDKLEITSAKVVSSPDDIAKTLRWTGIVNGLLPNVQIAASTGIHNGDGVLKALLAGAQVTQLCSTIYINGYGVIEQILSEMESFMKKWNFKTIKDFRGKLNYAEIPSFEKYERAQFMKYFSGKELL
jgi:dihydroorotate dehydrogenase (fumarate)